MFDADEDLQLEMAIQQSIIDNLDHQRRLSEIQNADVENQPQERVVTKYLSEPIIPEAEPNQEEDMQVVVHKDCDDEKRESELSEIPAEDRIQNVHEP